MPIKGIPIPLSSVKAAPVEMMVHLSLGLMRSIYQRFSTVASLMAILTILFVICITAESQTTVKQTKDSRVEKELMQLERDWSSAFLKHDTATIDRILAGEYVGIDGRGIVTNKAQEIEEAKTPKPGDASPPFVVLDESITDMKIRTYGIVGVVNGRVIEKIRTKEKEAEIQYSRTTVWVKRHGRWQCVSFHGSRILEPTRQ